MRAIKLDEALKIINETFAEAARRNAYPLTAVVLDAGGRVKAVLKQDGASLLRFEVSYGKAYGSLALGRQSRLDEGRRVHDRARRERRRRGQARQDAARRRVDSRRRTAGAELGSRRGAPARREPQVGGGETLTRGGGSVGTHRRVCHAVAARRLRPVFLASHSNGKIAAFSPASAIFDVGGKL